MNADGSSARGSARSLNEKKEKKGAKVAIGAKNVVVSKKKQKPKPDIEAHAP